MKIAKKLKSIVFLKEGRMIFLSSLALFFSSLFLFFNQTGPNINGRFIVPELAYLLLFIFFVATLGLIFFFSEKIKPLKITELSLLLFFPSAIVLFWAISISRNFNILINLTSGAYFIFLGIYLFAKRKPIWNREIRKEKIKKNRIWEWFSEQGTFHISMIVLVIIINLFFGIYHIERFAAVDEPLWTFGRIAKFWNGIEEKNWGNTLISDKPGITVSMISGIGLIWENPDNYEPTSWQGRFYQPPRDIEKLNFALRFPIFIFTALLLPLLYFFLERLTNKNISLCAFIFIGLSPILIGISRIINPDSLLWIFSSLTILSYLVYLKKRTVFYLFITGILLGMAILTKYVANVLFVFFFGMIFLEYIFNHEKYQSLGIQKFIKESLIDFLTIVFFSIATFFVFCPMAWIIPRQLLDSTILSQAFKPIWPIFAALLGIILVDNLFFKSFLLSWILKKLEKNRRVIAIVLLSVFLLSIAFVFLNTYSQMRFIDFEEIFTSPKSSRNIQGIDLSNLTIFVSNFYPLVFGITPIAIFSAIFIFLKLIFFPNKKNGNDSILIFLVSFILIYYLGSAVTKVASISRYQISVYPVFLIVSSIGLYEFLKIFAKQKIQWYIFFISILFLSSYSLYSTSPFYSSYASDLLPKKYYTDLKDMGEGSYEAAEFLNSLPDSKNINIWVDKGGVCYFFQGNCYSGFNKNDLANAEIQYLVISSGRESRTGKMTKGKNKDLKFLSEAYSEKDSIIYNLEINERPNHFIRVIKID